MNKLILWYRKIPHWIVTLFCLVAAIVSYVSGFNNGAVCLIALGAILELTYWVRFFKAVKQLES